MIEAATPTKSPRLVAPVGHVRREGVESRAGAFANQVDDDIGMREGADLIAGAHTAVLHDDVDFAEAALGFDEQPA